ncbi:hypothetical protein [Kitasatospora sp. KL5]|uniref:hypothetical protein n=1 Tax=Kitasatospora sp. KL5 TaxID=3425125 RepID=UPI003D6FD5F7
MGLLPIAAVPGQAAPMTIRIPDDALTKVLGNTLIAPDPERGEGREPAFMIARRTIHTSQPDLDILRGGRSNHSTTLERVDQLDALGMIWSVSGARFEAGLDWARVWAKGQAGSLAAPARASIGGYAIGTWLAELRAAAQVPAGEPGALAPERRREAHRSAAHRGYATGGTGRREGTRLARPGGPPPALPPSSLPPLSRTRSPNPARAYRSAPRPQPRPRHEDRVPGA